MKKAVVTPLLKKKSSLNPESHSSYRPVSNLSFLYNVIERVVASRIRLHMQERNLYEPLQSAYRQHHGTETALLKVQNDILRALDEHNGVFLVLLDLSAAFDTIDHGILTNRLQTDVGISGTALDWIKSYLTDRYQAVRISTSTSTHTLLQYGVPQGSVLGPKMFSMPHLLLSTQEIAGQTSAGTERCSQDSYDAPFDHITPNFDTLHWLRVHERIILKTLLFVWKCLHTEDPMYLRDMIVPYEPGRELRSNQSYRLHVPRSRQKFCGDRAFSVAGPTLWNQLPLTVKTRTKKTVSKTV